MLSERALESPVYFILLGALCGLVGFRMGWRSGHVLLLPSIQGLMGWVAFAASWRARGAIAASLAVAGWVLATSALSIVVFRAHPQQADERIWRGRPYRAAMLAWLRTGRGPETDIARTVGAHVKELVLYLTAAVLSANFLSLVMGAALLNYMNAYVARLLSAARMPARVWLLGWNVWSVIRVASYVMLGSACAAVIAGRLGSPAGAAEVRLLWTAGMIGVALDLLLKLVLSRPCGRCLAEGVDLDRVDSYKESLS